MSLMFLVFVDDGEWQGYVDADGTEHRDANDAQLYPNIRQAQAVAGRYGGRVVSEARAFAEPEDASLLFAEPEGETNHIENDE